IYWTGNETEPGELDAWTRLGRSRSVADVLSVRHGILTPTLNMVAADTHGEIATISVGRWADRSGRPGLLDPVAHPPVYILPSELPLERNPRRGWVASANNRNVDDDYPYSLSGFHEPDYRIRRIGGDLDARSKHSVADMRALQLDLYSLHAADLMPALLELVGESLPAWLRSDLEAWDFQTPPASRPTLMFQVFYRHWVEASLAHHLPLPVVDRLMDGLGVGDVPMGFCDRLLKGEHAVWWIDDARRTIARSAMSSALAWLAERLGSDHDRWTWGALHTVTWRHPFGQIEGRHQRFVNVGPFPVGGDRTTVAPTGYDRNALFQVTGGPSLRLLADLRRPERTWATNTLGQTGRPLSRHYRDQVRDFLDGRLHPIWGQPARQRVVIEPRSTP
ncbi:MAG: penicillin acylase family protein, partial [Vicinamibacterales bacterium]